MSPDRPTGPEPRHLRTGDDQPPATGRVPVAPPATGRVPLAAAPGTGQVPVAAGPPGLTATAPQEAAAVAVPSPVLQATAAVDTPTAAVAATAVALRATADQAPATQEPRALTSVMPPVGPPGAEALEPPAGTRARRGTTSRSGLARLHIGGHSSSRQTLERFGFTGPARGLRLGVDRDGRPVTVRPFRREPTRIALVGGYWAAQLLAFRMLAMGACVVVATRTPQPWEAFGTWAVADRTRVRVVPPGQPFEVDAGPRRPTVVVDDGRALGDVLRPGSWQALLSVVPRLAAESLDVVADADLVALQRLTPDEAAVASAALRLTSDTAGLLQLLEPDMLALLGGGADRYVWVSATAVESGRFGAPQR
jgi:hypothetical protein